MARVVALTVAVLAALAPSADAEGMLPGNAEITVEKLLIFENGRFQLASTPEVKERYFNFAHCTCSDVNRGMETRFQLELGMMNHTVPINAPGEIWLGTNCNMDLERPTHCVRKDSETIADVDTLAISHAFVTLGIAETLDPLVPIDCPDGEGNLPVWVLVDTNGDGSYEYNLNQAIDYDTKAPPAPANPTAEAGEAAVLVTWEAPTANADDVAYYQALCAKADGTPAGSPTDEPRYQTAQQLCQATVGAVALQPIDIATKPVPGPGADAPPAPDARTDLPAGLRDLDPSFICGETGPGAVELRIEGLENDTDYTIAVVAIDLAGNAAGIYFTAPITPRLVTDFWEDLHGGGSEVEGGFCLISTTFGDDSGITSALRRFRDQTLAESAFGRWLTRVYYDVSDAIAPTVRGSIVLRVMVGLVLVPLIAIALLWHLLTLPGLIALVFAAVWLRRRRRRRALRTVVVAATVAALATTASAQSSNDPYWSDPYVGGGTDESPELAEPRWHVGLRAGPYIPAIDKQAGRDPGPYERMFGGAAVMPVLDIDWIFLRRFGQLGVGGSIGFMWKSAYALLPNSDPTDPNPPRSEGDKTTFRLLPIAITAVYRLSYLDDRYGIPIVPYVRGGAAYYIWWSGAPSGKTSVIFDPPGCSTSQPGCSINRARGATLGVQGSIGLAIRAERIDHAAARSMREGGVEHAGFYAELQLAKVDGFGNENKLAVGDVTWFAGVDFEF